jgi:hypothetical protein
VKRELKQLQPKQDECCPGHDVWPNDTYKNRRSKKARSRDKKKEHKYVRSLASQLLQNIIGKWKRGEE